MESRKPLLTVALLSLCLGACSKSEANASPEPSAATSGGPTLAESPKARLAERAGRVGAQMAPVRGESAQMKAILSPAELGYPEGLITPIAASCTAPWVLLTTAPAASGDDYAFPNAQQAFLANPSLKLVDVEPQSAAEVSVEVHKKSEYFLIARCHDAAHCNKVAAMYKDIVRSSSPETGCGDLPKGLAASTKLRTLSVALPQQSDTIGLCARLGACTVARDPRTTEDPGAACQKAPSSFKTDCALKASCAEVTACLGK